MICGGRALQKQLTATPIKEVAFTTGLLLGMAVAIDLPIGCPACSASVIRLGSGSESKVPISAFVLALVLFTHSSVICASSTTVEATSRVWIARFLATRRFLIDLFLEMEFDLEAAALMCAYSAW